MLTEVLRYFLVQGDENLKKALDYHRQHAEIADAAGILFKMYPIVAATTVVAIKGVMADWSHQSQWLLKIRFC